MGLKILVLDFMQLKIRQDKGAAILYGIKLEEGNTPIVQMLPLQSSASKNTNRKSVI